MQTVWKGSISFGLVSIPVRLVGATEERDISFRQVHEVDGGRIRYKRVCEAGHEVEYAEIAKGYELPDGDIVVLTDEDFANLPVASSKAVDVLTFVPFEEIDPTALSRAYYAEPTGDAKPYVLLRESLEETGRVAVVKIALRQRERLAVLRPRNGVLVVQTMLWPDEVRPAEFGFLGDSVQVRPQEMQMAQSYIDALSGDFHPEEYVDEYRRELEEVVQAKINGREIVRPERPAADTGKVVDLMEALRRSVEQARQGQAPGAAGGAGDAASAASSGSESTDDETGRTGRRKASGSGSGTASKRQPAKKAATKKASAKGSGAKATGTKASKSAAKTPAKSTAARRRSA